MIRYVSTGTRHFGRHPLHHKPRAAWEFYAVLHGRIAPLFPGLRAAPALRANSLWVFPSGSTHGWTGEKRKSARVAVFHYDSVPAELAAKMGARGHLCVSLSPADCLLIQSSARALLPVFWGHRPLAALLSQRVLLDLSLLALRDDSGPEDASNSIPDHTRVQAAETWFRAHLGDSPSLNDIACRIGTSTSHLGKLFRKERGCSPKMALRKIQMERAVELLRDSPDKLAVVATDCGFAKASSFCTAFKRHTGVTPTDYRRHPRISDARLCFAGR